jgi:Domain of unknown function (DUF4340)
LLVLSGAVWYSKRHPDFGTKSDKKSIADTNVKVVNIADDQIVKIGIAKRDGTSVELERKGGKWEIAGPDGFAADQDTVSGLSSSFAPLTADVLEDKASDLNGYGLANPAVTVSVIRKDGKTDKLLLGEEVPAGASQVYLQKAGEPKVYLAPSSFLTTVNKGVSDFRDKRLLTFNSDKVSRIELLAKKEQLEFGKTSQNDWQILKPRPLRADNFTIEELLRQLHDAKMDLAVPADQSKAADTKFASGQPIAIAKVTDASGTQTLEVRKNGDDFFARSSVAKGTYKISADIGKGVDKSLADFRNKKLFDFAFNDPNKIEIHGNGKDAVYTKVGNDWKLNGKTLDPATVQAAVDKLRDVASTAFVDTGFATTALAIDVTSNDGKRVEKLAFSKAPAGYVARRENEPALYLVDTKTVDDILKSIGDIKETAGKK